MTTLADLQPRVVSFGISVSHERRGKSKRKSERTLSENRKNVIDRKYYARNRERLAAEQLKRYHAKRAKNSARTR